MVFKNKSIVIVCQQDWGEMFISKHHYAVELAKLGNTVYFLNGPDQRKSLKKGEIKITATKYPNLFTVEHNLFFPYVLNFKARYIYDHLIKIHIDKILKKIAHPIDIVWSFDLSNTIPLKYFPVSCIKIFMPVDESQNERAIKAAETADIILSVTNEIIEKYKAFKVPGVFINHGVSEMFFNENINPNINEPLRVGLSGNFLRPDVDRQTLLKIFESNTEIIFECWGAVNNINANLVTTNDINTLSFIKKLNSLTNVILHGIVDSRTLGEKIKDIDCFLICYDINKDQSKGTNYHKILEYLATGKVVVSNNVTTYKNYPHLVTMAHSRDNNNELPDLFHRVVENIKEFNSINRQKTRIDFAKQHLYSKQIQKIEILLSSSVINKPELNKKILI
jgi:hypothetical protein